QPLMAVEFALGGALRGAGDTRFPLLAILVGLFVFRLGTALAIARPLGRGVIAVWLCLLADYAVKALLLSLRFASARGTTVRVEPGGGAAPRAPPRSSAGDRSRSRGRPGLRRRSRADSRSSSPPSPRPLPRASHPGV